MNMYVTLVFKSENEEQYKKVREMAAQDNCRAWSIDHELLRCDLMRHALDKGDIEEAKMYAETSDVLQYRNVLEQIPISAMLNA